MHVRILYLDSEKVSTVTEPEYRYQSITSLESRDLIGKRGFLVQLLHVLFKSSFAEGL